MEVKNRIVRYLLNTLAFFLVIFFSTLAQADTYYVDGSNGDDKNSGTISSTWKTISKANNTLKAGDTVYIRSGTYADEQIKPLNFGNAEEYITYKNYNDEKVILSGANIPIYLNGNKYIRIDGLTISNCKYFFVLFDGANHNIIQNCSFYEAQRYFGSVFSRFYIDPVTAGRNKNIVGSTNDYNRILNNTWQDAPDECEDGPDQDCNTYPSDNFNIQRGRYNLVEGNTFGDTSHDGLVISESGTTKNVIRGNTFQNTYRRGLNIYSNSIRNLVEENFFYDHGLNISENPNETSRTQLPWNPGAIQLTKGSNYNIIRKNIFANNGTVFQFSAQYVHFYHNTAYRQIRTVHTGGGDNDIKYNNFKNNIFANTESLGWPGDSAYVASWYQYPGDGYDLENNYITQNSFTGNNNVWRYRGTRTSLSDFESYTTAAHDNCYTVAKFVDVKNRIFRIQPNSDLICDGIDDGTWLTTIKSPTAASQAYFSVDNAGYFFDGWGIPGEVGDKIMTKSGKVTDIVAIDYNENTITVNPAIDIVKGEGLALDYSGAAPDIGAHEYGAPIEKPTNGPGDGSLTKPLPPPSTSTLDAKFQKATLNNGNEYYTDRTYTLTSMPSEYVDMDLIKTPNDERNLTTEKNYLTFELSNDVSVYVAFDSRATSLPGWMSGFSNTGDRIYTSLSSQPYLKVYSRSYSAGDFVNLGASKATGFSGNTVSNYIVFSGMPVPAPVGFKKVEHQN